MVPTQQGSDEQMGDLNVVKSEPVVVALSEVGEDRWGHHQFPTISALPDGRLFVTYNDTPDRNDAYGQPGQLDIVTLHIQRGGHGNTQILAPQDL